MNNAYKYSMIVALALSGLVPISAQAPSDAYRNTQEGIVGTARTKAMGGATGAVGADAGAIYINPAGIALFSNSIVGFGMNFGFVNNSVATSTTTVNRGNALRGFNDAYYFSRGYSIPTNDANYLRFNYGFAYGQEYRYNRSYEMSVKGPSNSLSDFIASEANRLGLPPNVYKTVKDYNPFIAGVNPLIAMGIDSDIVEFANVKDKQTGKPVGEFYRSKFYYLSAKDDKPIDFDILGNRLNVTESGKRDYSDFNFGFNLNDRFFFGSAIRLGSMTYNRSSMLREDFANPTTWTDPDHSYLEYGSELNVSGKMVSLNFGFLMALGDYGRIGISYLTPQYARYQAHFGGSVKFKAKGWNEQDHLYNTKDGYRTDYNMITPGKLNASVMAFLGRLGMISYDFQYRNLGSTKILLGNSLSVNDVTEFLKQDYGVELTHRIGIELRPIRWASLRAGYAYIGNPLKAPELKNEGKHGLTYRYLESFATPDFVLPRSYQAFTGGLGFALGRSTTLDLAYVHEVRKQVAYPFPGFTNPQNNKDNVAVKGGQLKENRGSFVANLTFRF